MIYISDKKELYKIIKDLDIREHFISFMCAMDDYYNGCRCAIKSFDAISDREYEKIKNDASLIKELEKHQMKIVS